MHVCSFVRFSGCSAVGIHVHAKYVYYLSRLFLKGVDYEGTLLVPFKVVCLVSTSYACIWSLWSLQSFYLAVVFHVDSFPSLCMRIGLPTWFLWLALVFGYMSSVYWDIFMKSIFIVVFSLFLKVDLSTCLGCDACLYGVCVFEQFYTVRFHWRPFFCSYILNMKYFMWNRIKQVLVTMCSPFALIASY